MKIFRGMFLGAGLLAQVLWQGICQDASLPALSPGIVPNCNSPAYTPVPPPDQVELGLNKRNRYRLVIGAGEFPSDPTMNRSYVAPTAALVDQRLGALGFKPLPDLATPYLLGKDATKANIMKALQEMAKLTSSQDYGIVYYVGHGAITPSHKDLSLAVYDEPVTADHGIRVSDVLGTLEYTEWRSDIKEIPHFLLILDACFSGRAAMGSRAILENTNNVQSIYEIENQIVPTQIALLAATASSDLSQAYELHNANLSAFGLYFARALNEDWACADSITPDGILTLDELTVYLKTRLSVAYSQHAIDAPMVPNVLNKDLTTFIAYDPSRHYVDGLRAQIAELVVLPTPGLVQMSLITLPNNNILECSDAHGCAFPISRSFIGDVTVRSIPGLYTGLTSSSGKTSSALRSKTLTKKQQQDLESALQVDQHKTAAAVAALDDSKNSRQGRYTGTISFETLVKNKAAFVAGTTLEIK